MLRHPSFCLLISFVILLPAFGSGQSVSPSQPAQKSVEPVPPSGGVVPDSSAPAKPTASSTAAGADLAKESVVIERSLIKLTYEPDGTGTREVSFDVRVQSQAGVQALGVLRLPYLGSNESVEFDYIRVRKPDGSVVNTPDYNIQDMPADVTRLAPMYSDLREKHVTVKALGVGDVLEYTVRFRTFKPQVPGQFWWEYNFDKSVIYRTAELDLTVPKDKYLNLSSPDYKPEIKDDGNRRTYIWRASNLKRPDPDTPVSQDQKPDIQFSTFHSWQEVGAWYNELQKSQLTVTPQLQAKAAELTKGLTTEDEKIRAIYNYVSSHFHYVSLSFGVGRYQPHPAEDVLENEYGDCKDKHTLLATLLKAAGIEAWPALINATRKLDPSMPSPGQFDHVITYVPHNGSPLWLDTTPEVAPFGLLMASLRNKQALIIPGDKPAELKTTPANPPFPANQTFTMDAAIDTDGTLKGHVQQTARGDTEVYMRLAFRVTAQAQWKDLVQRIVNTEGFGGDVSNVTASSPEDTSKPFEFSYDYTRKKYSDWDNHRLTAPLPPTGLEGASIQEKKPADPVQLGGLGELVYTAKITLPSDVVKLPSDVSLKESFADYDSNYTHGGDVLIAKRRLKIKENEVPLADWDDYKKFSKALSDDWGAYTDLYANAGEGKTADKAAEKSSAPKTLADTMSAEEQEKFKEASDALQRGDTTTAEDIIEEQIRKNPDGHGWHAALGQVYATRNDPNKAIEELTKEERLSPDYPMIYATLGRYYEYLKRDDSAATQYRQWVERDPTNYDAYAALNRILFKQKKYPEAVEMWQAAANQLPDNSHVRTSLGYAYLYNKQGDKAVPLLEQALTADTAPIEFNNAAYLLADENVLLEKAKQWGSEALRRLNQESLAPSSEEGALTNTKFLALTWDTVGWIYFRMGDYAAAERYLRSAFMLSQSATDGDHMAQTYQKLGKKQDAEHTYKLAYAQASEPLKDEIREHYQELMGKDADPEDAPVVLRRGPASKNYGAEDELSRARLTKISTTPATAGSATFSIVFSPGKIEDVKFISGDEKLKPMTTQIAKSKLRAEFPDSTPARLTRRGLLVCGQSGCDFTLLLPDTPYATESQR